MSEKERTQQSKASEGSCDLTLLGELQEGEEIIEGESVAIESGQEVILDPSGSDRILLVLQGAGLFTLNLEERLQHNIRMGVGDVMELQSYKACKIWNFKQDILEVLVAENSEED